MTKTCSRCVVDKPLSEFYGRGGARRDLQPVCKECSKERARAWARDNKERHAATRRRWSTAHAEQQAATTAAWRKATGYQQKWAADNRPARRLANRKWKEANKATVRANLEGWKERNPDKVAATRARRRAAKLRATPAWANPFFIGEAYHLAALRTKLLGYSWHVDHIVPLQSKIVCGLHVEHNLQVIPGANNISKHNRHWPGMP